MSKSKQTAVEWLEAQLRKRYGSPSLYRLVNQAKEMEKEQIIEAMNRMGNTDFYCKYEDPEQYYKETYKNTEE